MRNHSHTPQACSEAWNLKENTVLRRVKRAMLRAIGGEKLKDKKNTDELMNMPILEETRL